jgi:hypothetical protein
MKLSTSTNLTLCLALLLSLVSCGSEENDEMQPQDNQPAAQVVQPEAQAVPPKVQEEKVKAQNAEKKWLPPAMVDIGLTAEQEGKIKPVVLENKKQLKAVRDDETLDSAAKKEKLIAIAKTTLDQYKAILTTEQWKNFIKARRALLEKNKPTNASGKES